MKIVSMAALDALPPLYSQEDRDDPVVYVKLASPDQSWVAYLAEGSKQANDFVVFGLFIGTGRTWTQLPVSKLENGLQSAGLKVKEQPFDPVPLSRVVNGLPRSRRSRTTPHS